MQIDYNLLKTLLDGKKKSFLTIFYLLETYLKQNKKEKWIKGLKDVGVNRGDTRLPRIAMLFTKIL